MSCCAARPGSPCWSAPAGRCSARARPAEATTNETSGGGKKSEKNPFGVKEDAALDVVIFNGGYTDKYAVEVHEPLYKKSFPKAEIKHQATPEIKTVLQPRFAGGNPPDFVNNSGSGLDGLRRPRSRRPAARPHADCGTPRPWTTRARRCATPSCPAPSRAARSTASRTSLFYVSTVFGLWYSGKLFKDKGWTAPTDWDSFIKTLRRDEGREDHAVRIRRRQRRLLPVERHPHARCQDRWPGGPQEHRQPRGRRLEGTTR